MLPAHGCFSSRLGIGRWLIHGPSMDRPTPVLPCTVRKAPPIPDAPTKLPVPENRLAWHTVRSAGTALSRAAQLPTRGASATLQLYAPSYGGTSLIIRIVNYYFDPRSRAENPIYDMVNPQDYTVGWICALPVELSAAAAFLDDIHPFPVDHNPRESNIYALGTVGIHNVVIAAAPVIEGDALPVDAVWRDMVHCFPNVRIALGLRVYGSAPNQKRDVRLGDVLVGSLRNGYCSLTQHDEAIQALPFQDTGSLAQSFESLRMAVCGLRQEYELNGHQLEKSIQHILGKWPQMQKKYSRPSVESDAPVSDLQHPYSDSDHNYPHFDCCSRLLPPRTRDEPDCLRIHYGFITSVSQQSKEAQANGKAATDSTGLCFEMAADEQTDRFPCLVVRGVCDYASRNRNETWHGFAALAAAAYTKDLLYHMPPNQVELKPAISEAVTKTEDDLQGLVVPRPRHQGSDEISEPLCETSNRISYVTTAEYCASCNGTCASDPTLAPQTELRSSSEDCRCDEPAHIVYCQQLHGKNTDTSSVESHYGNTVATPPSLASNGTSRLERERQRDAYISGIQEEDVIKLASHHNYGRECTVRRRANGSFNVCFFVEFPSDGQKWVVRFPICPVLHEPWQKLRSEVATMEYVV